MFSSSVRIAHSFIAKRAGQEQREDAQTNIIIKIILQCIENTDRKAHISCINEAITPMKRPGDDEEDEKGPINFLMDEGIYDSC